MGRAQRFSSKFLWLDVTKSESYVKARDFLLDSTF